MDIEKIDYSKEGIITVQGRPDHYKVELHFSKLIDAEECRKYLIKRLK